MATAAELTDRAWRAHRRGKYAFWVTRRAVYAGFREHGCGRLRSFWEAFKWSVV